MYYFFSKGYTKIICYNVWTSHLQTETSWLVNITHLFSPGHFFTEEGYHPNFPKTEKKTQLEIPKSL